MWVYAIKSNKIPKENNSCNKKLFSILLIMFTIFLIDFPFMNSPSKLETHVKKNTMGYNQKQSEKKIHNLYRFLYKYVNQLDNHPNLRNFFLNNSLGKCNN